MYEEYLKYLKTYEPNDTLIKEGEEDNEFFCLLQGKVGIWKGDPEKPESYVKVGEMAEKGTYFGEMGYLLQEARTASITAIDKVKVLRFPGEMLPQLIMKQSKLGLKICTTLADRLKGTTVRNLDIASERNTLRDDNTNQLLHAKEAYQKIFIVLTAIQTQLQHPMLKAAIEYMGHDKLLQGGKKIHVDEGFLHDLPPLLSDPVKQHVDI